MKPATEPARLRYHRSPRRLPDLRRVGHRVRGVIRPDEMRPGPVPPTRPMHARRTAAPAPPQHRPAQPPSTARGDGHASSPAATGSGHVGRHQLPSATGSGPVGQRGRNAYFSRHGHHRRREAVRPPPDPAMPAATNARPPTSPRRGLPLVRKQRCRHDCRTGLP